jgi:formylglycine-generating enzyme required for sulfatase activity
MRGPAIAVAIFAFLLAAAVVGAGWRSIRSRGPIVAREDSTGNRSSSLTRVNPIDGLTYVSIPAGTFVMGCSPSDTQCFGDEQQTLPHYKEVNKGFWLGRTEVTQAAWKKIEGTNPSRFKGDRLPIESVNWNQANEYCKTIGGRLPTEKEWEYAARAGAVDARYGSLDTIAWYAGDSGGMTHPVGLKQANAFGLYDMLGNVWEWTADDFAPGTKVQRGGSWVDGDRFVRLSVRYKDHPEGFNFNIGFRCVSEFH